MAGKGRGIAAFTFNLEALGITRGSMPEAQRGPAPIFPQIEYKPGPLKAGEDEDYIRALKQEMRGRMKDLPFNVKPYEKKSNVERYKEKYAKEIKKIEDSDWTPEWNRLPKELKPQKIMKKKTDSKKSKVLTNKDKEDVLTKLDELEKKGDVNSDEEDDAKVDKKGEGEEELEGDLDEEEIEEENDYIANYFEDGDDYGAGSDDNMDEATY
ncbi:DNA-directed RNA polymerase III subunit RPC7 [Misgurnus anguillicaudatus]|uniref:DNA-directed RNA polymerase III subunit RPC7 n=1 Tax=Misgurnus anguillicaudatus TaxID=75329 RepID=UPI002434B063|nr:DNA-directed RNA polymerase III subunit RPC7 [Misgurnus anguillicaudatus]